MNDVPSYSDEAIDALIRRSLDRCAEQRDPRPAFDRLMTAWQPESATMPMAPLSVNRPRAGGARWGRWAVGASAAAAVLVLFALSTFHSQPVLARAETLVREAKKAHRLPLDRCYLVEVRRDSPLYDQTSPMTATTRQTRLWTRGDRFWVESVQPQQRWAWGRDERNRVWIAVGPHRGLRLDPDEVPPWLDLCCDLFCIKVEQLLGTVLRDFDLERESSGGDASPATQIVRATPRPGPRRSNLRSVVLEIDAETRVVRRMVIERMAWGQPFATATYTLADTQTLDDRMYQLEGHLSDPHLVFTRDFQPERRQALLTLWFGPRASGSFRKAAKPSSRSAQGSEHKPSSGGPPDPDKGRP
jgi:hypothetical protein